VIAIIETPRNRALLAVFLTLVSVDGAFAQRLVGSRASGMAGAFVAVADDASAVYWNPAGIATGTLVSAVIDFGQGQTGEEPVKVSAGQRDTGFTLAFSATAIGLAYYRLGAYGTGAVEPAVSDAPSREEVRRSVQGLTTSTLGVSLLQSLGQHIVVGVTPKYMWGEARRGVSSDLDVDAALDTAQDLDGPSTGTFDVDAGVMVAVNHIRLGLVGRNLTTPEFGDEPGDVIEVEREVRAGAAWGSGWTGISRVVVSVDGDILSRATPSGDRRDLAAGVETWWMQQRLGLRGGWRQSTIGDARAAFAAGISAGLTQGMLVEAHVVRGDADERSWGIGARMTF
jgi:hypothetical protein